MPVSVTPQAAEYASKMIDRRATPTAGIRIGCKGGGCSGLLYVLEFCDKPADRDRVIEIESVKFFIDPKSDLYLGDTVLDFVIEKLQSGLKFLNPREKDSCGCGVSFSV